MRRRRIDLSLWLLALLGAALAAALAWTFAPGLASAEAETASAVPASAAGSIPRAATTATSAARGAVSSGAASSAEGQGDRPPPAPAEVAAFFGPPHPPRTAREERRPSPLPPPAPAESADWLRAVGGYEDASANRWIIVKDDRTGRAVKLRSDGVACEDGRVVVGAAEGLVVELGSKRYRIKGR